MSDPQSQEEIDRLMRELAGGGAAPPPSDPVPSEPVRYEAFGAGAPSPRPEASLDLLNDVNVNLRVELGGTRLPVRDILKLGPGSVVTLDNLTGEPVNVFVNDRLVARVEVIVVDDSFAVRVTEVLSAPKNEKSAS